MTKATPAPSTAVTGSPSHHPVVLGLLGAGVVGGGVIQLLQANASVYAQRLDRPLQLKRVAVRDLTKPRDFTCEPFAMTADWEQVVTDPDIDIIVELMGGEEPARTAILRAIAQGKHVVTANKELIAKHGREIYQAAAERGVNVLIEGSVAGGIPIILPLKRSLVANRIVSLMGIVNGTTNYILTEMTQRGRHFPEVLREAQAKGYAEADPTADTEGYDAVYKLAILASLIFGKRVAVDDVYREGITTITPRDIDYARELGYVIKLLAIARQHDDGMLEARVHPTLVPQAHPLAAVNDVFNAVWVEGDAVGGVLLAGRGAGRMPTASAVISDILNVAADLELAQPNRLMACHHTDESMICPIDEVTSCYYLRLHSADRPGVLGAIGMAFADAGISIHYLVQKQEVEDGAEIVLITHPVQERMMHRALFTVQGHPSTRRICSLLRVMS